jgi:lipocalin
MGPVYKISKTIFPVLIVKSIIFKVAFHDYRYVVIDTDYDNYAMIYSCLPFNGIIEENAMILSRKSVVEKKKVDTLKEILSKQYGVSSTRFVPTNQKSC